MKRKKSFLILLIMFSAISACEKNGEKTTNISEYNLKKSHNMGQNCMSCHVSGGEGEGWFTTAGTVYDSTEIITFLNPTIRLYTQPNAGGSLVKTIEGDALGNFYTTQNIDFSKGLYPVVIGKNSTKMMKDPIYNGKCNSCHSSKSDRITIN